MQTYSNPSEQGSSALAVRSHTANTISIRPDLVTKFPSGKKGNSVRPSTCSNQATQPKTCHEAHFVFLNWSSALTEFNICSTLFEFTIFPLHYRVQVTFF